MIERMRWLGPLGCLFLAQGAAVQGQGNQRAKLAPLVPAPPARDLADRVEYKFDQALDKQPQMRLFGAPAKELLTETAQGCVRARRRRRLRHPSLTMGPRLPRARLGRASG